MRAALVAIALIAIPAAASAQQTGTAHPVAPRPKPTAPGHGGSHRGSGNGSYETNVVVDPKDYIASPKPHHSNPPSTFTSTAGQETFGSVSSGR